MKVFAPIGIMLIYIFISCNSFFGEVNSPKKHCNAKTLQKDIQKNWRYNVESKSYITNDSFINRLNTVYYNCLYNADTSFIIKYFGRNFIFSPVGLDQIGHDFKTPLLQYSLFPPCDHSKKSGDCTLLYFFFNKNYKVIKVKKQDDNFDVIIQY